LLQNTQTRLTALEKYTRVKSETQFRAGASGARRELQLAGRRDAAAVDRAQGQYDTAVLVAGLEKDNLDRVRQQLDRCIVKAPQDGIVVYARSNLAGPIAPGATVHFRQPLFSLPDLSRMQVKIGIHESMIGKVKVGQKAQIGLE